MTHDTDHLSLVADIGGTNTRIALARGVALLPETIRRYRNADHASLESAIATFVADEGGVDCNAACVAVAGPVRDGRGTLTNLDWTIDEATLARATGAETVAILNDLQAQGHALGRIEADKMRAVIPGPDPAPDAPQLVLGVGTGFNIAPVHTLGGARLVTASESGHVTLPVRTEADLALARFVGDSHGFPALEEVLSGRGLSNVDAFVGGADAARRPGDAIMAALNDEGEERARAAVHLFIRLLGNAAGDIALSHLPRGGIFLIGGVARAVAPHFDAADFTGAFRDKGRFGTFMEAFPVWLVEDDYAALIGVAAYLAQLAERR